MTVRVHDDRRRTLDFPAPPKRVVSLVPSDTFNVAALGCDGALVGRTDYCELPEATVAALPSVGGTKNPRIDQVCDLQPDLVLVNQEENTRGAVEALVGRGLRVYVAFPKRVADGLAHLARLARVLGVDRDGAARDLLKRGYEELRSAEQARASRARRSAFCPIWMEPLMTIHGSTFISDMLALCGLENAFADRERRYPLAADRGQAVALGAGEVGDRDVRYPRVTLEEVIARAPEVVVLPDEPHRFTDEERAVFAALDIPAARRQAILRVDGKDLCWYGARSIDAVPRLRRVLGAGD